MTMQATAWKY